jgi:hypothetical protein
VEEKVGWQGKSLTRLIYIGLDDEVMHDEVTFLRLRGTAPEWSEKHVGRASSLRSDCLLRDTCHVSRPRCLGTTVHF